MKKRQERELIKHFSALAENAGKAFSIRTTRHGLRVDCDGVGTTLPSRGIPLKNPRRRGLERILGL